MKTIEEIDYYCRLHNKAIIIHHGKYVGFIPGYRVGRLDERTKTLIRGG